jgi:hypothetical protein
VRHLCLTSKQTILILSKDRYHERRWGESSIYTLLNFCEKIKIEGKKNKWGESGIYSLLNFREKSRLKKKEMGESGICPLLNFSVKKLRLKRKETYKILTPKDVKHSLRSHIRFNIQPQNCGAMRNNILKLLT